MIIGITGTLGSGKGTVVEYLKSKGFKHYSVTRFLVEEIGRRKLEINRDNMVLVANDLRNNFGASYIVEQIYNDAVEEGGDFVVESIRAIGEAEFIQSMENCYLFSVNADVEIRYNRIKRRGGLKDNVSFEEFVMHDKREFDSGDSSKGNIKTCMEMSDFSFENNDSKEKLFEQVDEILKKIEYDPEGI